MGKIIREVKEDNFVKRYTNSYDLSVLIGLDRFSFLVSDTQHNLLFLRSYTYNEEYLQIAGLKPAIEDIFNSDNILKSSFKRTTIGIINSKTTMIPAPWFHENFTVDYLANMVPLTESDEISYDFLEGVDAYHIYALPKSFLEDLHEIFSNPYIYHGISALILSFKREAELQRGHQLFINVQNRLLQIFLFDGARLLFFNSFPYQSSKDFIYYVMLIYDRFDLNPEEDPVYISGKILEDSEIYHLLFRYVRFLNLVKLPTFYRFRKNIEKLPKHLFFDLLSLKLCE